MFYPSCFLPKTSLTFNIFTKINSLSEAGSFFKIGQYIRGTDGKTDRQST